MLLGNDRMFSMTTSNSKTQWQYLEPRPHEWRKHLYFKGKRLKAFDVWMTMLVEEMSLEETALDWDLPLAAIEEAIKYCQTHQDLLEQEAKEERRHLEAAGISVEPKITTR
ncbi:MAG: hypothetical protein RLZZ69_2989 [Cyanobacteriota bacterium]